MSTLPQPLSWSLLSTPYSRVLSSFSPPRNFARPSVFFYLLFLKFPKASSLTPREENHPSSLCLCSPELLTVSSILETKKQDKPTLADTHPQSSELTTPRRAAITKHHQCPPITVTSYSPAPPPECQPLLVQPKAPFFIQTFPLVIVLRPQLTLSRLQRHTRR